MINLSEKVANLGIPDTIISASIAGNNESVKKEGVLDNRSTFLTTLADLVDAAKALGIKVALKYDPNGQGLHVELDAPQGTIETVLRHPDVIATYAGIKQRTTVEKKEEVKNPAEPEADSKGTPTELTALEKDSLTKIAAGLVGDKVHSQASRNFVIGFREVLQKLTPQQKDFFLERFCSQG